MLRFLRPILAHVRAPQRQTDARGSAYFAASFFLGSTAPRAFPELFDLARASAAFSSALEIGGFLVANGTTVGVFREVAQFLAFYVYGERSLLPVRVEVFPRFMSISEVVIVLRGRSWLSAQFE